MTGNPALIAIIREEIHTSGPLAFSRFMELALYHPEHGYYASGRALIGRSGDFFTNVSVGATFGRLLAAQFAEIWEKLGRPDDFTIVEQGAQDGQFAYDVLEHARIAHSEFFERLRYTIVEPFPILAERQRRLLDAFNGKVYWHESVNALEPFTGVHFSNELFDALPTDMLVPDGKTWRERFVDWDGEALVFREGKTCGRPAPARVVDLIESIGSRLLRGYFIAIDYGHTRAPATLQARRGHQLLDSPLEYIGQADITAHVDWTSIVDSAEAYGLELAGFCDQHHFFTGIVSDLWRDSTATADPKSRRALQTLLHPEMLGRKFQVLVLQKNADANLAGLHYARDGREALGLAARTPRT